MTINDEDLESLFDSIVEKNARDNAAVANPQCNAADVISQLGKMTRTLHDALRELGLNKQIERVASSIPDARDRLNYVAALTQQAAERVLNATEAAQPLVQVIESRAQDLGSQWKTLYAGGLNVEEFKALIVENEAYLRSLPDQARAANGYLMEIMMAQDFQDLTGQVIKKIIDLIQDMEKQLLALLLENTNSDNKAEFDAVLSESSSKNSSLSSQDEVDDLLGSLGF